MEKWVGKTFLHYRVFAFLGNYRAMLPYYNTLFKCLTTWALFCQHVAELGYLKGAY